jgi:hypothetical protein
LPARPWNLSENVGQPFLQSSTRRAGIIVHVFGFEVFVLGVRATASYKRQRAFSSTTLGVAQFYRPLRTD